MIFRFITQLLLIQQLLFVVESFSTNSLRFPTIPSYTSRSSTVNDSPTISFIGKKPLARATINLRDIEFTVVSSAILSVSYDTIFRIHSLIAIILLLCKLMVVPLVCSLVGATPYSCLKGQVSARWWCLYNRLLTSESDTTFYFAKNAIGAICPRFIKLI